MSIGDGSTTHALVLGGGGVAGVAWHTGILCGLAAAGVDVTTADLIVGTSAGATVAAQLGGGAVIDELFERQVDTGAPSAELTPRVPMEELITLLTPIYAAGHDRATRSRLLGQLALATDTVDEAVRRRVIAARLAGYDWSDRPVTVVAVDASSGRRRTFDRSSGVDLVDAVAASCAVPGVWPPVTIGEDAFVDGGVWSATNTDLVAGHDRVLVLAPIVDPALAEEIDGLGSGVRVEVVAPDEASRAAFGSDVLDPAVREPSARAGWEQGRNEAERVGTLLGS